MQSQLNKEAMWAILLTLCYFLGWAVFAYLMPQGFGWLGFPLWFEWACIYLPLAFVGLVWIVVKTVYQDIPLDNEGDKDE